MDVASKGAHIPGAVLAPLQGVGRIQILAKQRGHVAGAGQLVQREGAAWHHVVQQHALQAAAALRKLGQPKVCRPHTTLKGNEGLPARASPNPVHDPTITPHLSPIAPLLESSSWCVPMSVE